MKVLVVDDEPHIAHMLRFLFERHGHQVVVAEDGRTALRLVEEEAPDLIFLDLNLPDIDGFQVCQQVRSREGSRDTPLYILTAQGQDINRERGLSVGATGYITKPFSPRSLLEIVESHRREDGGPSS